MIDRKPRRKRAADEMDQNMKKENIRPFGRMPDGTAVHEITLRRGEAACGILTYGGAVRSLTVPARDGGLEDVALGFDTLEDYMTQDKYLGALVGRYANRIGGAGFTLNGREYALADNDNGNSLHGGDAGFDRQVWRVAALEQDRVTLSLTSPDGQGGYPGTLEAEVTYALTYAEDIPGGPCATAALDIEYRAVCDKDTVFNPTSHIYFNLSGHGSGPVTDQTIAVYASRYTPVGPGLIPTGEIAPVDGTPMDLREMRPIGEHIDDPFGQLALGGGYDHNWAVDGWDGTQRPAARAGSPKTGISMAVYSDMPGVQFYTGNFLGGCPKAKGGAAYGKRSGFCLETQFFPDSPNRPQFPSCVLRAGEKFKSGTRYEFCRSQEGRDRPAV